MSDPVIAVFGATGGIGSEVVRLLETSGNRVAAFGRSACDATSTEEVEKALSGVIEREGRLDGIANCVGSLLLKPAHLTTPDDWDVTLRTNLGSAFAVTRGAGRLMRSGGSVVLVSSAAASVGLANHEAIAAAKAGIEGLTRSAAATYASRGLRFNAVAPGLTKTPLTERITSNEVAAKASAGMHALGRFGEAADVARAIVYLLDPVNDWMTGQVIGVDGGLSRVRPR